MRVETGPAARFLGNHKERFDVIHSLRSGFDTARRLTMPELLVLAVIVGLIVAIAIPAYQSIA